MRRMCGCKDGTASLCGSNCRLSRVTIIGDAAHPMSPFKGQGANQALIDGVSLARALHQSPIGLETERAGIRLGAAAPRYAVQDYISSDFKQDGAACIFDRLLVPDTRIPDFLTPVTVDETSLVQALQVFEESMLARTTIKARASNDAVALLHSQGDFFRAAVHRMLILLHP